MPAATAQAASLRQVIAPRLVWNRWIPQVPTARQAAFLLLPQREAFYGGSGGGGKSSALLMGALQYVHVPGYSALILRRHYTDLTLSGALMDRARSWLEGTDARWNQNEHTWHFPSGASVSFGYLSTEDDRYRYYSAKFQYVLFDELCDFPETKYTYLFSRLRRLARSPVPLRMRSASNPGGMGQGWVKERFIEPAKRGERDRPFIPARIADNPFLDVAAYRLSLAEMSALDRQRIEEGDWGAIESGTLLQRHFFPIVDDWPRTARLVRYWDLASTVVTPRSPDPDWTVGVLMALHQGRYWIVDVQRIRGRPNQVDQLMEQTAALDGRTVLVRWEEEGGASGKRTTDDLQRRLFVGFDAKGIPSVGNKLVRARPFVSAAEAGNVHLVRGAWNAAFLDVVCIHSLQSCKPSVRVLDEYSAYTTAPRLWGWVSGGSTPRGALQARPHVPGARRPSWHVEPTHRVRVWRFPAHLNRAISVLPGWRRRMNGSCRSDIVPRDPKRCPWRRRISPGLSNL